MIHTWAVSGFQINTDSLVQSKSYTVGYNWVIEFVGYDGKKKWNNWEKLIVSGLNNWIAASFTKKAKIG